MRGPLVALLLSACSSSSDGAKDAWTVFVYGHADHNLSASLAADMQEMSKADLGDRLTVIVLADWDSSQRLPDGSPFPAGAEWYRIRGGGEAPELLYTERELNLDDPAVLAWAVENAFTMAPAERRALILWDHGGGWEGGYGSDSQDGADAQPRAMAVPELARAVRDGARAAGIDAAPPFELLAFDTCLMGGIEVIAEVADLAHVYVANAEIDYGDGWDYQATLTWLGGHPDASPEDLARNEGADWDRHHAEATASDRLLRSHVTFDLGAAEELLGSVDQAAQAWSARGVDAGRAAFFTLPVYSSTLEQVATEPTFRDLGQFLAGDAAVSAALERAVLARSLGSLRAEAGQSGVHVELSLPARLTPERLAAYAARAPAFTARTHWDEALAQLAALDDAAGPAIAHELIPGDAAPSVAFRVDDTDVAEARVELGVVGGDAGELLLRYGLVGAGVIEPGVAYEFAWDGTLPAVAGQGVFVFPWIELGASESGELRPPILAVLGTLANAAGEQAMTVLLFQDGDDVLSVAVVLEPSPVTFPLADLVATDPSMSFTPLLPVTNLSTGEATALGGEPIPLPASGEIPIGWAPAPGGRYALMTTARDIFGNQTQVADTLEMP